MDWLISIYNQDMEPAIFLDRDGVIIENRPNYVRHWSDVVFYPQALAALEKYAGLSCKFIIITNQSAVGRGIISLEHTWHIQRQLEAHIRQAGGRVDASYMCPHAPDDECNCRKPKPGLLLQAAEELAIDLSRSVIIGDSLGDVQAGAEAGLQHRILLQTGRGKSHRQLAEVAGLEFKVFPALMEALDWLAPYYGGSGYNS